MNTLEKNDKHLLPILLIGSKAACDWHRTAVEYRLVMDGRGPVRPDRRTPEPGPPPSIEDTSTACATLPIPAGWA